MTEYGDVGTGALSALLVKKAKKAKKKGWGHKAENKGVLLYIGDHPVRAKFIDTGTGVVCTRYYCEAEGPASRWALTVGKDLLALRKD